MLMCLFFSVAERKDVGKTYFAPSQLFICDANILFKGHLDFCHYYVGASKARLNHPEHYCTFLEMCEKEPDDLQNIDHQ